MLPISNYIKHPNTLGVALLTKFGCRILPDKFYLSLRHYATFGKKMDWENPVTYNEKLQWLKIYERKPEYTIMADKYLVKDYIANIIGEEYIIPTIGVWDKPEDIDWDALPNQFVMKCNHNSGTGMIICKDKSKLDIIKAMDGLRKGLREDYSLPKGEWVYRNIPRKIIAEQFMVDEQYGELRDYKFFCFDGEVKLMYIATDRSRGDHAVRFDYFDADFNHLPFTNGHPNARVLPSKPALFDEMKKIATILSKDIPSVRVDLYEINGKIYFGEMTFYHMSGFAPFNPPEWDTIIGGYIKLPKMSGETVRKSPVNKSK